MIPSKQKSPPKYIFGLQVKRDTTTWNVLVFPLLPFIAGTINFYSTSFLPLLLEDSEYYNVSQSDLGTATSFIILWASILPLILTPFLTYVYEAMGRRIPIIYALLCTNLMFMMMPRAAPNLNLLCLIRAIIGLNNTILLGNPLCGDYIK